MPSRRRVVRLVLAAALVVSLAPGPGAGASEIEEVRDELERTKQQLEDAEAALEQVREDVGRSEEELHVADLRVHAMQLELRAVEAELAEAEAALEVARTNAEKARRELERLTLRLAKTQEELSVHEDRFRDRVAAAYKYGTISYASVLLKTNDVNEFLNTTKYVASVMDDDHDIIVQVGKVAQELVQLRADADRVREDLAAEEDAAESLAADVATKAERQRDLTARVEAERAERAKVVARLESQQAEYEDLVGSLEAESESLAAELKKLESIGRAPGPGGLFWPTQGHLTSGFGWRTHPIFGSQRLHAGIDIGGSTGQPIIAAASGVVVSAGWRGGYGLAVVISHGGGMATLYAHQSSIAVAPGQTVDGGQVIGYVGSTGYSTGPHLHFEVRINGEPRDPLGWY